jgi:D-aminoacyl-tRNA deacylase
MSTKNHELILLVSSQADPAGSLIHDEVMRLLEGMPELAGRYQHRWVSERLIYLDGPSLRTEAGMIIFLSRHSSKDPRPVLTVHVTGNFGNADYGGNPKTLTPAATGMMHAVMNRLEKEVPPGYAVTYEATHHGPTDIPVPSFFVEVGSTEKEWHDPVAAAAVARAVVGARAENVVPMAGFGGTHYAKRQTDITLTTRGGFGHIMPTRDLAHLTRAMFREIICCSGAQAVYIDRKSVTRENLGMIEQFAAESSIPVVGQSDLEGLKDLPFDEYLQIISLAHQVLPGASVTVHALTRALDPVPLIMAADLIAEAAKINSPALDAGLDELPVAHLSGNGVAFSHIFIAGREEGDHVRNGIIRLCISIICSYYGDQVQITGNFADLKERISSPYPEEAALTITEKKFSPGLAAKLGIRPGKDFGKLAAGETLSLGDRLITPDQVLVESVRRILIYPVEKRG